MAMLLASAVLTASIIVVLREVERCVDEEQEARSAATVFATLLVSGGLLLYLGSLLGK